MIDPLPFWYSARRRKRGVTLRCVVDRAHMNPTSATNLLVGGALRVQIDIPIDPIVAHGAISMEGTAVCNRLLVDPRRYVFRLHFLRGGSLDDLEDRAEGHAIMSISRIGAGDEDDIE